MKKLRAYRVVCPKCKLVSYTIVSEVYGSCPYCRNVVRWKIKKELFGRVEKEAV
jgi:phage FluMu protein Com